jgi:hypothetical protein
MSLLRHSMLRQSLLRHLLLPQSLLRQSYTSTVTDSLCNSGAFSNPNAVRDCPFNLKGAWFLSRIRKFFSYAALLFLKLFSPLAQLRMMTNHYTKWLRVKRLRLVDHDQKLGKKNNGTKTKSLPNFVFKESKI